MVKMMFKAISTTWDLTCGRYAAGRLTMTMGAMGLAVLALALLVGGGAEGADYDVELTADILQKQAEPGETAKFEVMVNNTGNLTDTFELTVHNEPRQWTTFQSTGKDTLNLTLDPEQKERVWVLVALPDCRNATGADREALEETEYFLRIKAMTSDYNANDIQGLTVEILDVYYASLKIMGDDKFITYPFPEAAANDRQEKFTLKLKNQGNRDDRIHTDVVATSYPGEWDVGIYTNIGCSYSYSNGSTTSAGSTRTLYICATPDRDSDSGNVTLIIEASADDGTEDAVTTTVTLDVREPVRRFTLQTYITEVTLSPEEGDDLASTAKFKIVITNDGTHDDRFIAQLDTSLNNDWDSPTGTNDDYFFTKNTGNSPDRWNANGQDIEKWAVPMTSGSLLLPARKWIQATTPWRSRSRTQTRRGLLRPSSFR